ncbi:hypothetical protein OH492_02350 [Vibrio chagasii]|nr:hypothetical protein [Vibrio chagasii]
MGRCCLQVERRSGVSVSRLALIDAGRTRITALFDRTSCFIHRAVQYWKRTIFFVLGQDKDLDS